MILRALFLASFAIRAKSAIHESYGRGGDMVAGV